MELNELSAISPIDGRYRKQTEILSPYFSEFGLIKYRVLVEVEYFISLTEIPLPQLVKLKDDQTFKQELRKIYLEFSEEDAVWIKNKEKITNHDVKAVEYFIKYKLEKFDAKDFLEFIHFGLTSQDINNTSIPKLLKDSVYDVMIPTFEELLSKLKSMQNAYADVAMLAKTHGQPASPTRMGKEIGVFVERIEAQLSQLKNIPFSAKFGGATGNFNAHNVAYPSINWVGFGNNFVNNVLQLNRSQLTTQIEHYDNLASLFDCFKRINTILIDLDRDFWQYISMEYFKQKVNPNETGSSAMPHKVNPIDFENSEGNLGIANAIFEHLSAKLPISRLQRDLTDSTVLRNIGVPVAHTLLAIKSLMKGLNKVEINETALWNDLEQNWAVVAEAYQTILRREAYPAPYEALKEFTRGKKQLGKDDMITFVHTLKIGSELKEELLRITPQNYLGIQF